MEMVDPEFSKWLQSMPVDFVNALWIVFQLTDGFYVDEGKIKDEDIYKFGYKLDLKHKQIKDIITKDLTNKSDL